MNSLFDDNGGNAAPIFIGGSDGGGTGTMAGILGDVGVPIGSNANGELISHPFDRVCDRFATPVLEQVDSANYSLDQIDPGLRLRVLQALELAAAAHTRDVGETPVWAANAPRLLLFLPFLAVAFPGLRFVHVVRDGRDPEFLGNQDQSNKHFRALFQRPPPGDPRAGPMAFWSHTNIHAATFGRLTMGGRYQILRLEDLRADFDNAMTGLFDRLGLGIDLAAFGGPTRSMEKTPKEEPARPQPIQRSVALTGLD